jgi:transcriptional regulator with XRE-family HTH domain
MGAMEKSVHTPEYSSLRAELLSARQRASLSQRELAARLKVSHSWVAKVEAGERRIDPVELCWIAAACGADPLALFERFVVASRARGTRRHGKEGRPK